MKVVIAPDSFKESVSASQAASALAEGVLAARPDAVIDICPMADGGEGTVEAMVAATGGQFRYADTFDPLGSPRRARFGLLGRSGGPALPGQIGLAAAQARSEGEETAWDGDTAIIEMAAANGLALVPAERRDPRRTTTFGTGKLILAALDAGAKEIILGIGGSATVDGGCGCAQALGVLFLDQRGELCVCGLAGGGLAGINSIDLSDRDPRLAQTRLRVACDVTNPLLGPHGAAAVFGPQKGATPEVVEQLEAGLTNLAKVLREKLGVDIAEMPGGGAAGGLGAGLVAFAGAKLESGVELVAGAVGLGRRLAGADLCLTGEGKLDGQSAAGKTAVGVARLARRHGVPVLCIPGQAAADAPREFFRDIRPLVAGNVTVRQAMTQTESLLKQRAAEAVKAIP